LRQFTEAGIPLVQQLADKFSELRGETVSTAEVFDLISRRAVSFGMVSDIFDEMTSAGGMFYDMQNKQAKTLAGQWTNLKDAISIAYDEMGRTKAFQGATEGFIDVVKLLVSNWRDVADVVASAALGIGVYVASIKSAAVASQALTTIEAGRLALNTKMTTSAPRLITAIFGVDRAYKAQMLTQKALIASKFKLATATNVLTRTFWKLTAALMSNPWTALLAVITTVVSGLLLFSKRAESAEERANALNKAISDFQASNKDLTLVQEYEKLSNKVSKTEAEQKRLNSITRELVETFPLAAKGANEYAEALGVSVDKAKELALQAREVKKESLEALYAMEVRKIEDLKQKLQKAARKRDQVARYYNNALVSSTATEFTLDLREGRVEKAVNTYNELSDELQATEKNARALAVVLGYEKDEATKAIEAFGGWKKTLSEATESYIDATGAINQRPLFDKEALQSAESLDKMLDQAADNYQQAVKDIASNTNYLNSAIAESDEKQEKYFRDLVTNAEYSRDANYELLAQYNALNKITEETEGKELTRVEALKQQADLLQKIYDRYQEIREYKSKDEAESMVRQEFAGSIARLNVEPVFDTASLRDSLMRFSRMASMLGDDELAIELGFKADDAAWNAFVDDVKSRTASLKENIERASKAQDFFGKMLGLTGDRELSATLTLSVFGTTGDELAQSMVAQIRDAFQGVDISDAISGTNVNYNKLAAHLPEVAEGQRAVAQNIVDNWRDANANILEDIYNTYEEFMTFEERKTRIVEKENQERAKIIAQGLPEAEQAKLLEASEARQAKALGEVAIEEFKASEDWINTFEDIENLATPTIQRLRDELLKFIQTNKDLTPEQIKTLMREYQEFSDELIERTPWDILRDSIKQYSAASKEIPSLKDAVAKAERDVQAAESRLESAKIGLANAEEEHVMGGTVETAYALAEAQSAVEVAEKDVTDATNKHAQAVSNLNKGLNTQKKENEEIKKSLQTISDKLSTAESFLRSFADTLGLAEDSDARAFLEGMADSFGFMAQGISLATMAMTLFDAETKKFMSTNPFGWILLIGSAIAGALSMISNIKVRKANKEIERQQELLDRLERSYDKLNKTAEKTFGTEYLDNYNDRLENLYAQQQAYMRQAEAERSKGKKEDEDKTKEYLENYADVGDEITDLLTEVQERFAGTDLASAARDFANAWIDAYREFGSTTDAIGAKFRDMIQNMVVESVAGQIMQKLLDPLFRQIDAYAKDGDLSATEIAGLSDMTTGIVDSMDAAMTAYMENLRAAGLDIRGTSSGLKGISKDIATASEESILGLAAGINTQNFYISYVPQIYAEVAMIRTLLQGGATSVSGGVNVQDLVTMQNQHLSHLPNIAQNTANTVAECKAIVAETRRVADNLDRVIKPRGTQSSHTVNTSL
jgi:DNA repair exonuclease SbcCD ATPase subunit